MYKKIISGILILSLLSQAGCYSARVVTVEEVTTSTDIDEITIMTRDSLDIIFERPEFSIINDTLKGKGCVIGQSAQISDPFDWTIPLSEILKFELSEFDGTKTLIFTGATILGVVVLFLLFVLASGGIDL